MANDLRADLAQLIAGLKPSTPATRRAVYDKARQMLKAEVRAAAPFMPVQTALEKTRELESAIAAIEAEAARHDPPAEPASPPPAETGAPTRSSAEVSAPGTAPPAPETSPEQPAIQSDASPPPRAPEMQRAVSAEVVLPAAAAGPSEAHSPSSEQPTVHPAGVPLAVAQSESTEPPASGGNEREAGLRVEFAPPRAGPKRALMVYVAVAAIVVAIAVVAAAFIGSLFDRFGLFAAKPPPTVPAAAPSGSVGPAPVPGPAAELIKGAGFGAAAEQSLRQGNLLLARGDYDGAITAFDDAIRLEPRQPATYGNRAFAYWKKNNVAAAIRDYGEAIRLDPANVANRLSRAIAYNRIGEYQLAVADLDYVIAAEPAHVDALNSRCWARALLAHLQEALADCNEALRLRPKDPNILDSRGFVYLRLGRLDRAIADYTAALKVDPKLASSLYGRGLAKIGRGDRAGGNEDVAAARALDPEIQATFARYGVR